LPTGSFMDTGIPITHKGTDHHRDGRLDGPYL
jgi:hypothetical protein